MEVMNGTEFEQTEVLIGQQGETEAMGVSDDPMLMSMLSTGLYKRPLRTMIQEIMFNAWDAHRMAGIQDTTPIDIWINDTSGLIVRDYGPGIPDSEIHPIYCIYGNSTKRKNDNQTGGFGLGSKSPFAYTESFTVTSHHGGKKNMYLISRANDDNGGKPGRTTILKGIDTEEKGLMVVVPLKDQKDMLRTYEHIKDVLFLSGIKANIYFEQNGETHHDLIEAESVDEGSFFVDDDQTANSWFRLWAVYGGVRYEIEHDDKFDEEWEFLHSMAGRIGQIYIGFPPNSLTPLPNREGLNMSEKTVENIRVRMENMVDSFKEMILPAAKALIKSAVEGQKDSGIQPQFLAYKIMNFGSNGLHDWMAEDRIKLTHDRVEAALEQSASKQIAASLARLCKDSPRSMKDLVGNEIWQKYIELEFSKQIPEGRKYLVANIRYHRSIYRGIDASITDLHTPTVFRDLHIAFGKVMEALNHEKGLEPSVRIEVGDKWRKANWTRGGGVARKTKTTAEKIAVHEALAKGKKNVASKPRVFPTRMWDGLNGEELKGMLMMEKTIIVAKTVSALSETQFNMEHHFCPFNKEQRWHSPFRSSSYRYSTHYGLAPAMVIHQKKGAYDTAVQVLKDLGYMVIEANEPEKKVRATQALPDTPKLLPSFPRLRYSPYNNDWGTGEEIEDPKHYVYLTQQMVGSYRSREHPSSDLARWMQKNLENIVLVNSKARIPTVERLGAKPASLVLHQKAKRLLKQTDRLEQLAAHAFVEKNSNLPPELLAIPEIQKLFGIKYLRTKQVNAFRETRRFLSMMGVERWHEVSEIGRECKEAISNARNSVDLNQATEMCQRTKAFSEHELKLRIQRMKPGEMKMFSQKVARFLRTI